MAVTRRAPRGLRLGQRPGAPRPPPGSPPPEPPLSSRQARREPGRAPDEELQRGRQPSLEELCVGPGDIFNERRSILSLSGCLRSGPLLALKSGGWKVRERGSTGVYFQFEKQLPSRLAEPRSPGKAERQAKRRASLTPSPWVGLWLSPGPHRRPGHPGPKGSGEVLLRYLSARRQARK